MLDQELMNPPPPTPSELLRVLVDVYGPTQNKDNPFEHTKDIALKRLTVAMLQDAFGAEDPLSKIAEIALKAAIHPYPHGTEAQDRVSLFQEATQEIELHLELAADL